MQNSYSLIKKINIKTKGNIDRGKEGNKRIRLLILSYHYLPMNVIASYRPAGFAQHLHKFGIYPTIVTHRWELQKNKNWKTYSRKDEIIIEKTEYSEIIRLPRIKTWQGYLFTLLAKFSFTRKLLIFYRWMTGYLDPGVQNVDSYLAYRNFLFHHLQTNQYDLVMGIYSPHHHLKMCYEIRRRFGLPYILDFRDLWDNKATDPNYVPSGINKMYLRQVKKFWSKWLSEAKFFTTLSQSWIDEINKLTTMPGYIVMHGYDDDIAEIQKSHIHKKQFIILYVGSLYENQDLEGFLRGLKKFVVNFNPDNLKLVFLGSLRNNKGKENNRFIENIDLLLNKYLDKSLYTITDRLSRPEVLRWYKKSSILLSLTYNSFIGTYGGKFFEYSGTGRPILAYDNVNSIISKAVKSDDLGFVCQNADEIAKTLNQLYINWKDEKTVKKFGTKFKYSREFQTENLSKHIKNLFG